METKNEALRLAGLGLNDCEIARRLEVPRTTVRDWRKPRYVPRDRPACPLCGERSRPVVLERSRTPSCSASTWGTGTSRTCLERSGYGSSSDTRYPAIVDDAARLIQTLLPANRVRRMLAEQGRMAVVWSYSSHLSCLFPQHGDGKKHERAIVLEPWQRDLVAAAPWALLRGLIRSDGCVFVNRTGRYEYLSYEFANRSADILDLCEQTCRSVGLRPRRYARAIRLYRREDVALLVDHEGVKA